MTEIVIGNIIPLVSSVGDDDLLLVWLKQPGVLRLIKSSDYRKRNDVTGVVVIGGLVQANGIQAADGESVRLVNRKGAGITVDTNGVITITPGDGASNRIKVGKDGTVFDPEFLTRTAADSYYIPPFPVAQPNHGFANGNPARWNGTQWVKPGAPGVIPAGAMSPADDWSGIVSVPGNDANNFILYSTGKVTGLTGAGFTPGVNYWDATLNSNVGGWTTVKPAAFGTFEGKILASSATDGVILPFKRRSGAFRPAQSSPDGAGAINIIFRSPNLPANNLLAGVSKGSGTGALYRSTDNGINWTKIFDFPSGFTSLTDISQGPGGLILLAMGFTSNLATGASRDWIYTISQALTGSPAKASTAVWGSVGRNLNAIAYDGSYTYAPLVTRSTINNLYRSGSGSVSSFSGYAQLATSEVNDTMVFNGQVYFANNSSIHKTPISGAAIPIMPGATFTGETLSRLAYNSTNNKTVLVGTKSGNIYRTEDFTVATPTWSAAIKPGAATVINDMAFNGSVWFIATNDGLYRSSDDGKTWSKMYDGAGVAVTAVAADASGKVWIGDANGKIFVHGV